MEWAEIDKKASSINQRAMGLIAQIERGEDGCPLTLEGDVRHMILHHPTLCTHRGVALDFLYCVLGTGISWGKDGRLTDKNEDNYLRFTERPPWSSGERTFEEVGKLLDMDGEYLRRLERDIQEKDKLGLEEFSQLIDEIDERCQTVGKTNWYPGGSYSNLANTPENAQSDFREGAEEVRRLLIAEISADMLDDFGVME